MEPPRGLERGALHRGPEWCWQVGRADDLWNTKGRDDLIKDVVDLRRDDAAELDK